VTLESAAVTASVTNSALHVGFRKLNIQGLHLGVLREERHHVHGVGKGNFATMHEKIKDVKISTSKLVVLKLV